MKIVLIGSGNMATYYGLRWKEAGHDIVQVISPDIEHAAQLAEKTGASYSNNLNELDNHADVYLLAVKDDILTEMNGTLRLHGKLVVICAGAADLDQVASVSENTACLWSVFSVHKDHLPVHRNIPLVVITGKEELLPMARVLAEAISDTLYYLSEEQKKQVHLAAVFANNFTNHLYAISEEILKKRDIPLSILFPIISDTALKIQDSSPGKVQTGPAIRGDIETMKRHLNMLSDNVLQKNIYELLSESIGRNAGIEK